jgi:hypothetical protein
MLTRPGKILAKLWACEDWTTNFIGQELIKFKALVSHQPSETLSDILWTAIRKGKLPVIEALVQALGEDKGRELLQKRDSEDRSSLFYDINLNRWAILVYIISTYPNAFDLDRPDKDKKVSLHWALDGNATDCLELLLLKGADPGPLLDRIQSWENFDLTVKDRYLKEQRWNILDFSKLVGQSPIENLSFEPMLRHRSGTLLNATEQMEKYFKVGGFSPGTLDVWNGDMGGQHAAWIHIPSTNVSNLILAQVTTY